MGRKAVCSCGKRCHKTYTAAVRAALHDSHRFGVPYRIYRCEICGFYHLTTQVDD